MSTEQTATQRRQKRRGIFPRWIRPTAIVFVLIFFLSAGAVWIWTAWGNITNVMTALFAVLGVACAFLAIPSLYETHEASSTDTATPHAPGVITSDQHSHVPSLNTAQAEAKAHVPHTNAVSTPSATKTSPTDILPTDVRRVSDTPDATPPLPVTPLPAVPVTSLPSVLISAHSERIFLFNERLTNAQDFFGRSSERHSLFNRTKNGSSTSLIGSRRIGKSWLMTYLKLMAPTHLGPGYRVGVLDASLPSCGTVAGFIHDALEALDVPVFGNIDSSKLDILQKAVKDVVAKKETPVLCIDEFERLGDGQEFDLEFFTGLRAITQLGLCVVTASQKPLIELVSNHVKTSPFFNVFEQYVLVPFGPKSAKEFVEVKGTQAGFDEQERSYMLEYGKISDKEWPPLRLQLVGKMLLEDKFAAEEDADAYRPDEQGYWRDFEKQLNSTYQAVVGHE